MTAPDGDLSIHHQPHGAVVLETVAAVPWGGAALALTAELID